MRTRTHFLCIPRNCQEDCRSLFLLSSSSSSLLSGYPLAMQGHPRYFFVGPVYFYRTAGTVLRCSPSEYLFHRWASSLRGGVFLGCTEGVIVLNRAIWGTSSPVCGAFSSWVPQATSMVSTVPWAPSTFQSSPWTLPNPGSDPSSGWIIPPFSCTFFSLLMYS